MGINSMTSYGLFRLLVNVWNLLGGLETGDLLRGQFSRCATKLLLLLAPWFGKISKCRPHLSFGTGYQFTSFYLLLGCAMLFAHVFLLFIISQGLQARSLKCPVQRSFISQQSSVSVPTGSSSSSQESSVSVFTGPSSDSPSTTVVQRATTSSGAVAVSNASPTNGNGCSRPAPKDLSSKRGLCYNTPSMATYFGSKVSWAYNWGQTSGSLASSLEYNPMLWSGDSQLTSTWNANAKTAIANGASTLLAFNEPDISTQSNMDVPTAVAAYQEWMQPFTCQVRLAAPAVTNGGPPMGLTWLQNFLESCTGCTIDVIPIHLYDSATNTAYFQSYIQEAYAAGGNRPLWITEFGASGMDEEVVTFFQTVICYISSVFA
jgi:hypothetical protein